MKIAVCDDEKAFIDIIIPMLEQWAKKHNIYLALYRFTNGDDLIAAHQNECMDLIILDVIMPLLNGVDTARELRNDNHTVPIIFLTSSREYAVESYEIKAFHYLMKPIEYEKLDSILDDFLKIYILPRNSFTAKTTNGFCRITLADVDYLEAQNKKVLVHMNDGRLLEICEQFSKCVGVFSPEQGFCRCHRSYIVNLNSVEQFSRKEIITSRCASIPISRNSYAAFKEAYFNHMFE